MILPEHIRAVFNNSTCLYNKKEVEGALDRMAVAIEEALSEASPILLTVLKGGMVLSGGLLTRLDFPLEIDNIYATRYLDKFSGGEIEWRYEPTVSLKDRTVLIVDDILDRGITLQHIVNYCYNKQAARVITAVLLDKKVERAKEGLQQADFVGLTVDDRFVFGYGLDYKEYLRNAPGIYEVHQSDQ